MLELQNICYRVSTPEGELDILRDISITRTRYPARPKVATASNRGAEDLVLPARGLTMNNRVLSMNSLLYHRRL